MDYKTIGIAAGFFGLGAVVSWAVTADIYAQKISEMVDENLEMAHYVGLAEKEMQELAAYMEPHLASKVESETSDLTSSEQIEAMKPEGWDSEPIEIPDDDVVIETPEEKAYNERIEQAIQDDLEHEAQTEEVRKNLQRLIDQYSPDEEQAENFVDATVKTFSRDHRPPFVIDQSEYAWSTGEAEDYSKITLTYYPRERLLLDDADEPIEDVADVVGWRSLSSFGKESGDPDTVFVRCPRLLTDFEIVRENEEQPPLHVRYGMPKVEFESQRAAGKIKFRPEDQ